MYAVRTASPGRTSNRLRQTALIVAITGFAYCTAAAAALAGRLLISPGNGQPGLAQPPPSAAPAVPSPAHRPEWPARSRLPGANGADVRLRHIMASGSRRTGT